MRAARIENGMVADLWEVHALDCYGPDVILVEAPEHVQVGACYDPIAGFTNPPADLPSVDIDALREAAYRSEADPLFFKFQRGDATKEQWLASIEAIKARFPKV